MFGHMVSLTYKKLLNVEGSKLQRDRKIFKMLMIPKSMSLNTLLSFTGVEEYCRKIAGDDVVNEELWIAKNILLKTKLQALLEKTLKFTFILWKKANNFVTLRANQCDLISELVQLIIFTTTASFWFFIIHLNSPLLSWN